MEGQGNNSDFDNADVEWNIGEDENTREATDSIDIPTS